MILPAAARPRTAIFATLILAAFFTAIIHRPNALLRETPARLPAPHTMSDITARRASSISSLEHAPQRNTSSADSLHRQGPTADLFATIDRNGDGHIDRDEWNAAVAQADKRELADGEEPEVKRSRATVHAADEVTAETGDGGDGAVIALRDALDAYCAGMCDELSSVSSTFTMLKLRHSHGGGDGAGAAAAPAAVPKRGGGGLLSLDRLVKARQAAQQAAQAGGAATDSLGLAAFDKPFGRWLLTGCPGSGKSTMMKRLALSIATPAAAAAEGGAPAPRKRVPLLIELGRYAPGTLASLQLARDAVSRLSHRQLSGAEAAALSNAMSARDGMYDFVWLLDGLDEGMIGATRVNDTSLWAELEQLIGLYPAHSFIVSTRLTHLPAVSGSGAGRWTTLYIHDLSADESREFISKYIAFFDVPDVSADAVYASMPPSLAAVATTPLALSLVVSAYLTDGAVPGSLRELYRAFVSATLAEVEEARNAHAAPASDKDMALAALAFEMLSSSRPVIGTADARAVVQRRLNQIHAAEVDAAAGSAAMAPVTAPAKQPPDGGVVLDELVYSGLLRRGADYLLSFTHLTLLEYMAECEMSREFSFQPKAAMDQYFLRNMAKIRVLLGAAAIAPGDAVVEVGAGIGSVARHFPACASLTLVDLDPDLVRILRFQLRSARVLEADALAVLRDGTFDVVISNLPFFLTEGILEILGDKARNHSFKRAVMSVHNDDVFGPERPYYAALHIRELCVLQEDDFFPRQPFLSKLILVTARDGGRTK